MSHHGPSYRSSRWLECHLTLAFVIGCAVCLEIAPSSHPVKRSLGGHPRPNSGIRPCFRFWSRPIAVTFHTREIWFLVSGPPQAGPDALWILKIAVCESNSLWVGIVLNSNWPSDNPGRLSLPPCYRWCRTALLLVLQMYQEVCCGLVVSMKIWWPWMGWMGKVASVTICLHSHAAAKSVSSTCCTVLTRQSSESRYQASWSPWSFLGYHR